MWIKRTSYDSLTSYSLVFAFCKCEQSRPVPGGQLVERERKIKEEKWKWLQATKLTNFGKRTVGHSLQDKEEGIQNLP